MLHNPNGEFSGSSIDLDQDAVRRDKTKPYDLANFTVEYFNRESVSGPLRGLALQRDCGIGGTPRNDAASISRNGWVAQSAEQ